MFQALKRDKAFYSYLVRLTSPIALQNLITFSLGLIDTLMVSQLGNNEMAAVTAANVPVFLLISIVFGVQSAVGAIPALKDFRIKEVAFLHRCLEEFAPFDGQSCLGEGHRAAFQGDRREARGRHLVRVASAFRAAELQGLAVGFCVERKGEPLVLFNKLVGVSLGANEDEGHGFVPQPTNAAPRGCHGVESLCIASRDQHPLFADKVDGVLRAEAFVVCLFHIYIHYRRVLYFHKDAGAIE